jgi:CheY-like chemotaxis protein
MKLRSFSLRQLTIQPRSFIQHHPFGTTAVPVVACARVSAVRIYELMKALRVLVIEDDALIAMLLAEVLAGMGHDVCATAATEADAVIAAARHRPDLMIADARLGQGSGVSAVEEILRAGPVAHLFVSGDAERVQTRRPDAVVVRKPFRKTELAKAIDTALAAATPLV